MNILVLNWQDRLNPYAGGAETHLHEIFSRVAAAGHSVTLYCSHFEGAAKEEILDGMKIIREGQRNTFNFHVPIRYWRDFRHQQFDIIIDDINKIPFYTPLYVREPTLAIAHHLFGKSIFTEAGLIAGTYVFGSETLLPHIYRKTRFAAVSESTKSELIEKGIPNENVVVIPNCINQEQFPFAVVRNPETPPIITYFGRLKRYKSVHHLLEAFALVSKEFPTARLRIMGKGDAEPELHSLAKRLGLLSEMSPAIEFLGFVAEQDKARLLGESYCVVNPSMKEGWGIINIEANACGVPVIAANVPGLRDAVQHNVSGLLYEYGNVEELASVLRQILQNNELHRRLQIGALTFARQFDWHFSTQVMIDEMQSCITSSNSQK